MEHKHEWHVWFSDLAHQNLPHAFLHALFPHWILEKPTLGMISEAIWWRSKSNCLGHWKTMWNRAHLPLSLPETVLIHYMREKYTSLPQWLYVWVSYLLQPRLHQLTQTLYFCMDFLSLSTSSPKLLIIYWRTHLTWVLVSSALNSNSDFLSIL